MFNAFEAHNNFATKVAALKIMRTGIQARGYVATNEELEGVASYIKQLCKLTANHIEAVMADASASVADEIDETAARSIIDVGGDCAGQLVSAARELEAA